MIRWGVAGTGGISALFAESLAACYGGNAVAVASRDPVSADRFATEWDVPHATDYVELGNTDIDAVYVATPPALHCEHTLRYLDAGKHVLCEKPFATCADDANRMRLAARERGLFLMEGMWPRFLPAYVRVRELLAEKALGDILIVDADFGIRQPDRSRPEFNAVRGGGSMLTGGSYPLGFASMILGAPCDVYAAGDGGWVDEYVAVLLRYDSGAVATIRSSIVSDLACGARVCGSERTLTLSSLTMPQSVDSEAHPVVRPRLAYEIDHVNECLEAGLTESPVMPVAESCAIAATMDQIRA